MAAVSVSSTDDAAAMMYGLGQGDDERKYLSQWNSTQLAEMVVSPASVG